MEPTFYVTTAIFYANDRLHIGHCYEGLAADVIARYHRSRGRDVRLLTGTDEHGINIERRARQLERTPQDWVDEISASHRQVVDALRIRYDDFIRTTEDRHRRPVQQIFTRLYEQGDIYLDHYEGWYCAPCEAFWTESRVLEGNLCPDCSRPVEWTRDASYKFRLSRYAPEIERLLERPDFLVPESRRNEMLAFVRQGLEDIAVSRTTVTWGIPVPFDPDHRIYVWIDALSNYITALGYGSDDDSLFRRYWPANLHIVGKDIARFHVVIWPALLLALGLPLPKRVFAHGWLNIGGQKISKSRGNSVDSVPLVSRYGVDAVRYYLLRAMPFGPDGNYTEEALVRRINEDLANDLGNLLSRTTQMINKFAGGKIPAPGRTDGVLEAAAQEALAEAERALEELRLSDALAAIFRLVNRANKYIEERTPWSLARQPDRDEELAGVLYSLAETLRVTAAALVPFLVETPERIYGQLGLEPGAVRTAHREEATAWGGLPPGTMVRRGEPLFPRIPVDTAGAG